MVGSLSGVKKREATKNQSKTIGANIQAICLLFQTTAGMSDKRLQGDLSAHTTKLRFRFFVGTWPIKVSQTQLLCSDLRTK